MTDKLKKKPSFFTLKRWNSQKLEYVEPSSSAPSSPKTTNFENRRFFKNECPSSLRVKNGGPEVKPRRHSAGGIKELVQCPLCLEILHNAKMLPCQHTFCTACLTVYIADLAVIECPTCSTKIQVKGPTYVSNLPSNLYIESLLELVGFQPDQPDPSLVNKNTGQSVELFAGGVRCTGCKTLCDGVDMTACVHCKLNFCPVCWAQHLDDMRTQIGSILKQLDSASNRLDHKIEYFKDRCGRITEKISATAQEKISAILEAKEELLKETAELQKSGDLYGLALKSSVEEAKVVAHKAMADRESNDKNTVTIFVNLHQNAIQLLSDVSKWDTKSFLFDSDNFKIEQDIGTPLEAESDDPLPEAAKQNDPMESEDSLVLHYRSRNFKPHFVWRKISRPGGIAISPWNNQLYVCGVDLHSVLVVERTHAKILARLTCEDMLFPTQVAFLKSLGEVYVTDKWKHCIHVFSKDGEYLRSMGQKGSRVGMFRSPEGIATDNANLHIYVVDTGNDRVQVLQAADGKFVNQLGVLTKPQPTNTSSVWESKDTLITELNAPTSVAVTNDRVIILDSGHRRVKIYNKHDSSKIIEFGSMGQRKGQFRQPEVLAVDPMGFILVGDSGNCRVQVFKPNGQLVRVFGGLGAESGKLGWISGIHVTNQLDIIISDNKNHCVNFY